MARYCTQDDLLGRMQPEVLVELADDDGDGVADVTIVEAVIESASALIDGYCQSRYPVPISPVPDVVTRICVDLAIYDLHVRRGLDPDSADGAIAQNRKDAIGFLRDVSRGVAALPTGTTEPHTPPTPVRVSSRPQVFTEDLLERF